VLLASDAVHLNEELALERPFHVVADLEAMIAAYRTVREIRDDHGAVVVAGHDPAVMRDHARVDDLVVRIE
jgi:glyoxylase-like metal-dependent hydrolase (beta-lactamase superfamily II)